MIVSGLTVPPSESDALARELLRVYKCDVFHESTAKHSYLDLLCADGYGGNLCGVCVTNSLGQQMAQSAGGFVCGVCRPKWQVDGSMFGLFLVNLVLILIQLKGSMGERVVQGQLQFGDLFGLLITHIQFLTIIQHLGINWPSIVSRMTSTMSSMASASAQASEVLVVSCLASDGEER